MRIDSRLWWVAHLKLNRRLSSAPINQLRNVSRLLLFAFILTLPFKALAQQTFTPEEFKAAFIFQVLQNIEWSDEAEFTAYRVAIVGNEAKLLEQLKKSGMGKRIKNKPILFTGTQELSILKDFHLLFISNTSKLALRQIAATTNRTNTLLITEDTQDKTNTMINLVSHPNGIYTFEINKANITFEYLKMAKF